MKKPATMTEAFDAVISELSYMRLAKQCEAKPDVALVDIDRAVGRAQDLIADRRHDTLVQNELRQIAAIAIAAMVANGVVSRRDIAALFPNISQGTTK